MSSNIQTFKYPYSQLRCTLLFFITPSCWVETWGRRSVDIWTLLIFCYISLLGLMTDLLLQMQQLYSIIIFKWHIKRCPLMKRAGPLPATLLFVFFFFFFLPAPRTFGSSQARGQIRAIAAGLHHSSQQCWTLNPLNETRDRTHIPMDLSWVG